MLPTLSLVVLGIVGFQQLSLLFILIFALINALIGMFTPRDRIAQLQTAGTSPVLFYLGSLPLHLVLAAVVYGIGYGISLLF